MSSLLLKAIGKKLEIGRQIEMERESMEMGSYRCAWVEI
jgi:hypothetical protein